MTDRQAASITITDPAGGTVLGEVPDCDDDAVAATIAEVRAVQRHWEEIGPAGRARHMGRFRDWLFDHETELIDLLVSETGRPRIEAQLELPVVADLINFFSRTAGVLNRHRMRPHGLLAAHKRLEVGYRPYPVVGVISPFNGPLVLPMMDAIPALLAGAAVVVKPSEFTPLTLTRVVQGWVEDLEIPPVLAIVTGRASAGKALVGGVDYIQFTGSVAAGRAVARAAADRLIPCSLELGGKDAMIVLADAPVERAARAAVWGSVFVTGQACVSVERVYVEEPIYDRFLDLVTEQVRALRLGGPDSVADVGPIIPERQRMIIAEHVKDAVAAGAHLLVGGTTVPGPGHFFEPTVLADVDHTMRCMREETFGPVVAVMRVANADEAVRLANESSYGLSASVWSSDLGLARSVAHRLDVGAVNINDLYSNIFCPNLPMAPWKSSGLGAPRFGGENAVLKYCRPQVLTSPRLTPPADPLWYPYTSEKTRTVSHLLRAVTARGRRRLASTGRRSVASPPSRFQRF